MAIENVNWSLFLVEEKEVLEKLIAMGEVSNLVLGVLEMTQSKEAELQKIVNHLRPVPLEFESAALKQYKLKRLAEGKTSDPETPAEEAALQKILDDELSAIQSEHKKKSEVRQATLEKVVAYKKETILKPIQDKI